MAAYGFVADAPETLILGETAGLAGPELLVSGQPQVRIAVGGLADLPAVAYMEEQVWGDDWSWFVPKMTGRLTEAEPTYLVLAEDATSRAVVSAGWPLPLPGTKVAGLWGGSTLSAHRGRGIYRALVRARANEALRRGIELFQVDATEDSRPILESLGLTVWGDGPISP